MTDATVKVKVWDGWVRLFHWGTVACVIVSYVSAQVDWWEVHYVSGYAILALVLFRIAWGLVGSENARFAHFLHGPGAVMRHLAALGRREPDAETTHNPAGAWMVVAMLVLLLAQAVTGLFTNHDVGFTYSQHGPLATVVSEATSETMSGLHVSLINLLLAAIGLHVLAVLAYRFLKGQDLVRPMLTGVKSLPGEAAAAPRHAPVALGLVVALLAAAAVWWVTRLGDGA